MSFRDDDDARLARADALERELEDARAALAERERELAAATARADALDDEADDLRRQLATLRKRVQPPAGGAARRPAFVLAIGALAMLGVGVFVALRSRPADPPPQETAPARTPLTVDIRTAPPGATLYADGQRLPATSPARIEVPGDRVELRAELAGYQPIVHIVDRRGGNRVLLELALVPVPAQEP